MNEFLTLIETYQVQIPDLMQVCSAPLSVLLRWYEEGAPATALADLKAFLQGC
ncbi:MAG: hypothetical protein ACAF41_33490 (plasmid) [Leptolyngbya sp. BL-A-14]